jgi:glycosyltransferase involved in cell wall biosynthesis
MLSNALRAHAERIDVFSSASRKYFKGLHDSVRTRFVPSPAAIAGHILKWSLPASVDRASTLLFDHSVAALMGSPDLYFGWATMCLESARTAKGRGARFVLDRACPHCDFQQCLLERESAKVGALFFRGPDWFRQRQLDEYELADAILVPSSYTAQSFPAHLRPKLVKAPLRARCSYPKYLNLRRQKTFTVGVVGGNPLRKGYWYLLKAWRQLALPNAQLLLRSGDFRGYPALEMMLRGLDNAEVVSYLPDVTDFYRRCDVFILPSIDDGFGMALIEAMACGCACVTTTNTGASELLTNGKDALIVEPANEDQLASSILSLYESEERRQELALAARKTADSILAASQYNRGIAFLMDKLAFQI